MSELLRAIKRALLERYGPVEPLPVEFERYCVRLDIAELRGSKPHAPN